MLNEISNTSIHSSRTGYLYQDLFAITVYFENYLNNDFENICIDYPYGKKQCSIDIYKVCSDKLEIYEIKNGENFKRSDDEIKTAIQNFYEFSKNNKPVSMTLIISPELRNKIAEYWMEITNLSKYQILNSKTSKELAKRLTKNIAIPELNKPELTHRFIKDRGVKIDVSLKNYQEKHGSLSQLEKNIVSSVDQIANMLKANACCFEFPSEYLLYEMLQIIPRFAGTGENMKIFLDEKVVSFMARRLLLDNYKAPTTRGDNLSKAEDDIKNRVNKIREGESITTSVIKQPGVIK